MLQVCLVVPSGLTPLASLFWLLHSAALKHSDGRTCRVWQQRWLLC